MKNGGAGEKGCLLPFFFIDFSPAQHAGMPAVLAVFQSFVDGPIYEAYCRYFHVQSIIQTLHAKIYRVSFGQEQE